MTDRTKRPEDLSRYPRDSLFAILPDGRVEAAVLALLDAGYAPGAVEVLRDEHADEFRAGAGSGGLPRRLYNLANTEGLDIGRRYTEQRPGEEVVRVRAPSAEDARPAAAVLREHGGYFVNWFGELTTEEMG